MAEKDTIVVTENECMRMNLPKRYWDASWSIITAENQDIIKKYVVDIFPLRDGRGLLLYGNSGCGKTYMSVLVAKILRKKRYHVYFVSANDLHYTHLKKEFDEQQSLNDRVHNVDLLIIDDVDENTHKDMLYSILKFRMENLLSTIITMRVDLIKDVPVITKGEEKGRSFRSFLELNYGNLLPVIQGTILPIAIKDRNYREIEQKAYEKLMFNSDN